MCAGGLELGIFELEEHLVFGERGGEELPVRDRAAEPMSQVAEPQFIASTRLIRKV
jgi:hypothetical protein